MVPPRQGLTQLKQDFFNVITAGENTVFVPITAEVSQQAAELRVQYNLKLPDALQIAVAIDLWKSLNKNLVGETTVSSVLMVWSATDRQRHQKLDPTGSFVLLRLDDAPKSRC